MKTRLRGFGRCWQRPNGGWAISFYDQRTEHRESVARALGIPPEDVTEQDAKALLEQRLSERREGTLIPPRRELVTVADVLDNRIQTMKVGQQNKSIRWLLYQSRLIALELGAHTPIRDLTAPRLKAWTARLLTKGFKPGTVANRVANLRAAMRLAHKERLIGTLPYFPTIRVNNARQGFFEPEQARAVIKALPEPVGDLVLFEHLTGWRGGEVKGLQWSQIDRERGEIRLQDTKNGEGRVLPLVGDLAWLIERRWLARKVGEDVVTHVFHNGQGRPIGDFRTVWKRACKEVGVEGKRPHDLRRSAVRDMIDSGVDAHVAMTITGHRSMSTLHRYRIVDSKNMSTALERLQNHRLAAARRP